MYMISSRYNAYHCVVYRLTSHQTTILLVYLTFDNNKCNYNFIPLKWFYQYIPLIWWDRKCCLLPNWEILMYAYLIKKNVCLFISFFLLYSKYISDTTSWHLSNCWCWISCAICWVCVGFLVIFHCPFDICLHRIW